MRRPTELASLPGPLLRGRSRAVLLTLCCCTSSGCATFAQDVHLAPLFSNLSMAGGGRELEAVAGAVRVRHASPEAPWRDWALRPLVMEARDERGDSLMHFLVPLGTHQVRGNEVTTQFLPLFRYQEDLDQHGHLQWKLLALPGILWSQDDSGRVVRALFPIGGRIERSFTFDRIDFVLWPLYIKTQREGRTTTHVLYPIFAWSTKEGLPPSWRFWPLYGVSRTENVERRFWLWPLLHTQKNRLRWEPQAQEERFMLFPLFGHSRKGSLTSNTVLWPFFGWSSDPSTGFWSWDGPWPLVRVQRPGSSGEAERTRFWPFYSNFKGDDLDSTWYLWPFVNSRTSLHVNVVRTGENVVPIWQRWTEVDSQGSEVADWTKLWPLYQEHSDPSGARLALPALNPLWYTPVFDDGYAWIYELYSRDWKPGLSRERSWGGLWKREVDAFERRSYLTGLWARRRFREDGEGVSETSLLFGLLRWRSRAGHFDGFLAPAPPGPGFPMGRSSEPLEERP